MNAHMMALSWGWTDINVIVNHVLNILQKDGPLVIAEARNILNLVGYITSRNLTGIIGALSQAQVDIPKIVADIKAEFGL